MIDLHCHIIPYIDDGAKNIEIAYAMARYAYKSGVDTIVATPHCNLRDARKNYLDRDFVQLLATFRAYLKQRGLPIKILQGAEVFAHSDNIRALIEHGKLATINHSRYLLVEFQFHQDAFTMTQTLNAIARRGLIPIVAHPERYDAVQQNPMIVANWFERGYIIQINKGSLLGRLGRNAHECATKIISDGFAHVIASDAHDMKYRPPGFYRLILSRQINPHYLKLLLAENPERIISDEPILDPRKVHFD